MKKVIWRPKAVSRTALLLIALLAGVGMLMVEQWTVIRERPYYGEKLKAAELADQAFRRIYGERVRRGPEIDPEFDPLESGLIGVANSSVTSVRGVLKSKQTSVNPNFAAVIVDMLKRAGVKEGDVVGVGYSGSFPALNICTTAAIETLNAEPVIISSGAASEWGANIPDFIWLDMEKLLHDEGIFHYRSVAATIGGDDDLGQGVDTEGVVDIQRAIERAGVPMLAAASFEESVAARIEIMRERAGRKGIAAYINVGGGSVSAGTSVGKKIFNEGLNLRPPARMPEDLDGVMPRLSQEGVPVIHLVQIVNLAERFGLPVAPDPSIREMVEPGQGAIFRGVDYNKPLAACVLVAILLSLFGFIRSDIGFRILQGGHTQKPTGHPEPMV